MTADARKRLEALSGLQDLGAGFTLSTHDLEIRGAGELLGDEQSGQIQEIGYTLYTELLERAVKALKDGKQVDLEKPLSHGPEITLQIPALLPEDYIPDVHMRLVLYKRIANADTPAALKDLQIEMIDRFGLIPDAGQNLFSVTKLRHSASHLGIVKIDASAMSGRVIFTEQPNVDAAKIIHLIQTKPKEFKLDGQSTLKFFANMEKASARINQVEKVLTQLSS
jgi:transcription-repair coupling factor (superfamily II helicase)